MVLVQDFKNIKKLFEYLFIEFLNESGERIAQWLATCTWKPKVLGSSLAASYAQRRALCSNGPANVFVPVKWVEVVGVKETALHSPAVL